MNDRVKNTDVKLELQSHHLWKLITLNTMPCAFT